MRFYGIGYREAMHLPIRTFWMLNSNVVRLMAEEDIRALTIVASAQTPEAVRDVRDNLVIEMGEVLKEDPIANAERDEKGISELKAMCQ